MTSYPFNKYEQITPSYRLSVNYTDFKAQVIFAGELSSEFDISQGTGQGRILAPFMYKVYINSLLNTLAEHSHAISMNCLTLFRGYGKFASPNFSMK